MRGVEDLRAYIKQLHSGVTDADLEQLIQDCKKYENNYPNIAQEIQGSVDAVQFRFDGEAAKRNTSIEEVCTSKHFIITIGTQVKADVFKGKSVYSGSNVGSGRIVAETSSRGETLEIKPTELMQRKHNEHKDAHPEFGKALHVYNRHLDFEDATPTRDVEPPVVVIGNPKYKNFLNVKPQEINESIRQRLSRMTELLAHEVKRVTGVAYDPPLKQDSAFNDPRFLIGRLTYEAADEKDAEPKFSADRVIMEIIARHEVGTSLTVVKLPLNFTCLKQNYFLYPNMVIAVEVTGDVFIPETDTLQVHRIIELGSDKDSSTSPQQQNSLPTRMINNKMTVLFFKGPYTMEGNLYFGGINMIDKHVNHFSPQHVIVAGPFIAEELIKGEMESSGLDLAKVRSYFLEKLAESLGKKKVHLTIVQDTEEYDNFFPIPVPYSMETDDELAKKRHVTRVGSPCLLTFAPNFHVAISPGNFQTNVRNLPFKTFDEVPRFGQLMRSFVGQRSLHSLFPGEHPFDVSQQDQLSLENGPQPTVWIYPSTFTQFVREERGVICANPRTIFDGQSFFSALKIEAEVAGEGSMEEELTGNGIDRVRVEVIQF